MYALYNVMPHREHAQLHQKDENTSLYVEVVIKIVKIYNQTYLLFIATCFGPKCLSTGRKLKFVFSHVIKAI